MAKNIPIGEEPDVGSEREFIGSFCPVEIYDLVEDEIISYGEAFLLLLVTSLVKTKSNQGCWGSNAFLAKKMGCSERQVRNLLDGLEGFRGSGENRKKTGPTLIRQVGWKTYKGKRYRVLDTFLTPIEPDGTLGESPPKYKSRVAKNCHPNRPRAEESCHPRAEESCHQRSDTPTEYLSKKEEKDATARCARQSLSRSDEKPLFGKNKKSTVSKDLISLGDKLHDILLKNRKDSAYNSLTRESRARHLQKLIDSLEGNVELVRKTIDLYQLKAKDMPARMHISSVKHFCAPGMFNWIRDEVTGRGRRQKTSENTDKDNYIPPSKDGDWNRIRDDQIL